MKFTAARHAVGCLGVACFVAAEFFSGHASPHPHHAPHVPQVPHSTVSVVTTSGGYDMAKVLPGFTLRS